MGIMCCVLHSMTRVAHPVVARFSLADLMTPSPRPCLTSVSVRCVVAEMDQSTGVGRREAAFCRALLAENVALPANVESKCVCVNGGIVLNGKLDVHGYFFQPFFLRVAVTSPPSINRVDQGALSSNLVICCHSYSTPMGAHLGVYRSHCSDLFHRY